MTITFYAPCVPSESQLNCAVKSSGTQKPPLVFSHFLVPYSTPRLFLWESILFWQTRD